MKTQSRYAIEGEIGVLSPPKYTGHMANVPAEQYHPLETAKGWTACKSWRDNIRLISPSGERFSFASIESAAFHIYTSSHHQSHLEA